MLKKLLLLILLFSTSLFACAMCRLSLPVVYVYTTIIPKEHSTTLDIKWQFHPAFTPALTIYDVNNNGKFERAERDAIKKSIEDYIAPINYLIDIEYIPKNKEFNQDFLDKFVINYSKLTFDKKNAMRYEYNIDIPIVLKKDQKLYLKYFDDGNNFDFIMKDVIIKNYNGFKRIEPDGSSSFTTVYFYPKEKTTFIPKVLPYKESTQNINPSQNKKIEKKETQTLQKQNTLLEYLSGKLAQIKHLLELNLQDIKQNNSITSYFWLLLFSLLYGIIHALGPGHGKTLVTTYFLGQNRSYMKAVSISSMIGIVHTFSAFVLTLIVYYIVGTLLSSFIVNVEKMAIKVSAAVIILIALYLLFQKFFRKKKPLRFSTGSKPSFIQASNPQMIHTNTLSCSCNGCKTQSSDIGVILAAGLVPCPGTVTIFIFTMSLGIYFVGFLSAVFMSIGMSLIIFLTALISVKIRKRSSSNTILVKLLEYGSVFFILILGVILFII